jgi:pimeloyl-ACP methyl ester carboxylesterase
VPSDDLSIDAGEVTLAATLTLPEGAGPFPVLVAVHGASGGTRHDPLHEHLHALLPDAGVAVLTYDRRGEGRSTGDAPSSFEPLVDDATAVVGAVRKREAVDPSRVSLWGFSQGGWIAPPTAVRDTAVRALVLVSPSGVTPGRQMAYATARVLRLRGVDDRTIRSISALRRRLDDAYRRGEQRTLESEVDAIRSEPWFADAYLPDPADPDDDAWTEQVDLDVTPVAAQLRAPVLITHGEDDRWVPIAESVEIWRRAYRGPKLDIVRLPGTGHSPTHPEDPDDLEERGPISAEYERAILGFVARWV